MGSKKKKHARKKPSSGADSDAITPSQAASPKLPGLGNDFVLNLFLLIAVLVVAIQLFHYASGARFFTDECCHAIIARHASRISFPVVIPELFTEMRNVQPPLLHATSGVAAAVFGESAFKYMNVIFLLLATAGGYFLIRRYAGLGAARIAILVPLTCPLVYQYALRFYQEEITFACTTFAGILLYAAAREPSRWRMAAVTGAVLGLTVLAKQSGLVFFGVVGALGFLAFPFFRLGRRGDFLRILVLGGFMLLFALPFLLKNLIAFGSPFYPMIFSKVPYPEYAKLFLLTFGVQKERLFTGLASVTGPVFLLSAVFAFIVFASSVWRRRPERSVIILWIALFVCSLGFILGPGGSPRHWIALIPFVAVLAAVGLAKAFSEKRIVLDVITGVLIIYVCIIALDLPDYRSGAVHAARGENSQPALWLRFPRIDSTMNPQATGFNASNRWDPVISALKTKTTGDDLILSVWAYTPAYHARRRVTWPDPSSPKSPVALFETKLKAGKTIENAESIEDYAVAQYAPDRPERLTAAFREHGITVVILDISRCRAPGEPPTAVSYPHFMWYSLFRLRMEGKVIPLYNDFRSRKVNGRLEPVYFRDQFGRPRPMPGTNNPFILLDIRKK
ncbi:MAG: hypothetical protein E3J72_15700 [Planctomycetota bacterium]|nr:MAG: hypothetical protein E3J72_15700 [Planctomycetota bacterium]